MPNMIYYRPSILRMTDTQHTFVHSGQSLMKHEQEHPPNILFVVCVRQTTEKVKNQCKYRGST